MRLISISCQNYRQYKNLCLEFPKTNNCDMHVILASNGVGKTNFLNAINWCLYGDEPHVSGVLDKRSDDQDLSDRLPLYNIQVVSEAEETGQPEYDVSVTITLEDSGATYEIKREQKYKTASKIQIGRDILSCKMIDANGGTSFLAQDEIPEIIERFLPKGIREYFYFDGEQLLTYFSIKKRKNIQDSVSVIAQINIINNVSNHLDKVMKEYSSKINANSPQLKMKEQEYEKAKAERENKEKEISDIENQIREAEKIIAECDDKINGKEFLADKNKQYEEYKLMLEKLAEDKGKLENQLIDIVNKYFVLINLYKTNLDASAYINERKKSGSIYPDFSSDEIQESIKACECRLCGGYLDSSKLTKLKDLLLKINNNVSAQKISDIAKDVIRAIDIGGYESEKQNKLDEIRSKVGVIEDIKEKADQIWKSICAYGRESIGDVTASIEQKKKNEELKAINQEKKGRYREQLRNLEDKENRLRQEYDYAVEANKTNELLNRYYKFAKEAKSMVDEIRSELAGEVRTNIADVTTSVFDRLIWKKDTYGSVELDENYNIKLYHKVSGDSCLNSCSAAEKELLALAFTLAIHKVSGYDSFLFIDTPVGRVSDFNRKNFADVLLDVSENKQIVLAFTPSEYSEEISEVFNKNDISSFTELKMVNNVTEVK